MKHLFCDACGDQVKAVRLCKFIFYDGLTIDYNICLDCMKNGELRINLSRRRLVAKVLKRLTPKRLWRNRSGE